MRNLFFFILLTVPTYSWAQLQFSPIKRALDNLSEGDASRAKEILFRALERDSLDPGVKYGLSVLYNSPVYATSDLDSSYYFIMEARKNYSLLEQRDVEKLIRAGVDSSMLESQKISLDSQAFEITKSINTVEAYREFRKEHPTSYQVSESKLLEVEVAYKNVTAVDDLRAYEEYLYTYPESEFYDKALERFELLLFRDKTSDRKLSSYMNFLNIRPESPYRSVTENHIFEIMTAGNRIQDFKKFFTISQENKMRTKAADYIFHILKDRAMLNEMHNEWLNDSLALVRDAKPKLLIPTLTEAGIGFIEPGGSMQNIYFDRAKSSYNCTPPESDILIGQEGDNLIITTLSGDEIHRGKGDSAEDLGFGLIRIERKGEYGLIHKSGFEILPTIYVEIKMIASAFVATKINGKWGLMSFTGRQVLPNQYDNILAVQELILIEKEGKIAISSINSLRHGADGVPPPLVFIYDEYEEWSPEMVWVRSGTSEAIINNSATFDIELGEQLILYEEDCFIQIGEQNRLMNSRFETIIAGWQNIEVSENFAAVSFEDKEVLLTKPAYREYSYDSILLWGNTYASGLKKGDAYIHFASDTLILLRPGTKLNLIRGTGKEFLAASFDRSTTIFDSTANVVMKGEFEIPKILGDEYLVINEEDGKKLYSSSGELLLEKSFEAFGGYEAGGISILEDGKLGYYHWKDSIFIEPAYSRRIKNMGNGFLSATDEEGVFIIDRYGDRISQDYFQEVNPWNDSLFFIKKEGMFALYSPSRSMKVSEDYSEAEFNRFRGQELLVRDQTGFFGIIHPDKGFIIPTGYTFIEPYGTFWKAERYFSDADYYLLAYYSSSGELVFRSGLKPEQYELLICED